MASGQLPMHAWLMGAVPTDGTEMSGYRTPPELTLRRGFCFSLPVRLTTDDARLCRDGRPGSRLAHASEARGLPEGTARRSSRSTDGGADAFKVRSGGAPYSRAPQLIRFEIFAAPGGIAFPVVKRVGYFVPHWGARLDSSPGNLFSRHLAQPMPVVKSPVTSLR